MQKFLDIRNEPAPPPVWAEVQAHADINCPILSIHDYLTFCKEKFERRW